MRASRSTGDIQSLLKNYTEGVSDHDDLPSPPPFVDLEANLSQQETNSCKEDALMLYQYFYTFSQTFLNSGIGTATLISLLTNWLGMESVIFGFSSAGIGVAIPFALLLAFSEANSHQAKSEHFAAPMAVSKQTLKNTPLTWKQSIQASLHYCSDFFNGIGNNLLQAKFFGIDQASLGKRVATYAATTLHSLFGNGRELLDSRAAFKIQNLKK